MPRLKALLRAGRAARTTLEPGCSPRTSTVQVPRLRALLPFGSLFSPAGATPRLLWVCVRLRAPAYPQVGDFLLRRPLVTVLHCVDRTGPRRFPGEPSRGSAIGLRPRPTPQRLACRGAGGAAPTALKMKASTMKAFRGSITPLRHLLCTLHEIRYRMPCNRHFRLVGCTLASQVSNRPVRNAGSQLNPSSMSGLLVAQPFLSCLSFVATRRTTAQALRASARGPYCRKEDLVSRPPILRKRLFFCGRSCLKVVWDRRGGGLSRAWVCVRSAREAGTHQKLAWQRPAKSATTGAPQRAPAGRRTRSGNLISRRRMAQSSQDSQCPSRCSASRVGLSPLSGDLGGESSAHFQMAL